MGILTGILGFLSTLAALNTFADTCFRELGSNDSSVDLDKQFGPALVMLLIATILKAFDVWAHIVVPVPEHNYWKPDGNNSSNRHTTTNTTTGIDNSKLIPVQKQPGTADIESL